MTMIVANRLLLTKTDLVEADAELAQGYKRLQNEF